MKTQNRRGKFTKSAIVFSNDPRKPKTTISILCSVKQYVSVTPSNWIKLLGTEGDKISKKVTISSLEGQPLEITDITCDIEDKIKYKLKTLKKGREYTLEVKNRSKESGIFLGKINLQTTNEKKPLIVLSVYCKLQEKVLVKPATISFGTIDTSKEDFNILSLQKKFTIKDVKGDGFTIKKMEPSKDWIMTRTKTLKKGKFYTIVITLNKSGLPKGQFEEHIDIRTSYKRKPLKVMIKGVVL